MIHKTFTIAKVCNVYFLKKIGIIFLQEHLKILSHDFLKLYLNFLGQQFLNLPSSCISEAGQKLQKKIKLLSFLLHIIWVWWIPRDIYQILNRIPLRVPMALQSLSHDLCSQQLKIMTSGTIFHGFHIKWDESAGTALKHLVICRVTLNMELIKFHNL